MAGCTPSILNQWAMGEQKSMRYKLTNHVVKTKQSWSIMACSRTIPYWDYVGTFERHIQWNSGERCVDNITEVNFFFLIEMKLSSTTTCKAKRDKLLRLEPIQRLYQKGLYRRQNLERSQTSRLTSESVRSPLPPHFLV